MGLARSWVQWDEVAIDVQRAVGISRGDGPKHALPSQRVAIGEVIAQRHIITDGDREPLPCDVVLV
jgi:hypothetical protein